MPAKKSRGSVRFHGRESAPRPAGVRPGVGAIPETGQYRIWEAGRRSPDHTRQSFARLALQGSVPPSARREAACPLDLSRLAGD